MLKVVICWLKIINKDNFDLHISDTERLEESDGKIKMYCFLSIILSGCSGVSEVADDLNGN